MYTINDIQIFIATHNRASLIKESIESLLNQTIGGKEIIVLDNESTDNTEDVVMSYKSRGVKYIKTFGFLGNFYKAKEIADKKFVMLFHDDDILHPEYLQNAIDILNKENDVSAIYTRYTEFKDNNSPKDFSKLKTEYHLFKTQKDFAVFMFFVEIIAYATAIYRTEIFKKIDLEYEKFNKFNDWPFMVKFGEYGKIILFEDKSAFFVRRHDGQDTWTYTNIPSFEQIVNWDKFFYDIFFKKEDIFLRIAYNYKSACFMDGKYEAFIPPKDKNKFSLDDLHNLAKQKGLIFPIEKKGLFYRIFSRLAIEYLSVEYMKIDLFKKFKYLVLNLLKFVARLKNKIVKN